MVIRLHTTMTCRQLGNNTTYDTEEKNPTSHDVADTSAVSGRRVGKTRNHVVKTNCGRHLKKRHFQLSRCRLGLLLSLVAFRRPRIGRRQQDVVLASPRSRDSRRPTSSRRNPSSAAALCRSSSLLSPPPRLPPPPALF